MSSRMLGRLSPSWCPVCRAPAGPDCPDRGRGTRAAKRAEQRDTQRAIEEARGE